MKLVMESLLLSLLLIISAAAISPGSTLYASNTNKNWSSPNRTFSLQFIPVPIHTSTSSPSFMIGIVYSGGVPIIWTAGGGASVDFNGSFKFLSNGTLQLVKGSGTIVWDSGTSHLGVSSAFLDEQGNLVLSNGTTTLWSSFDHPTDTTVGSQNFRVGMVLRSGLYSFSLVTLGSMMLRWNDSVVYWNERSESVVSSLPNTVGYADASNELRVLKLDSDGNLRIYSSSWGSGSAMVRWVAVKDQCKVYGYCGENGICSYENSVPACGCPSQHFEMIDPTNIREGCRRKVRLDDCLGTSTMLTLHQVQFLTYPPLLYLESFFIGIDACRGNCLSGGCIASTALSDGTGSCYIKTTDFLSGYQSPALASTSYIKVCPAPALTISPSQPQNGKQRKTHHWILMVVLGTLVALISFQGCLWLWFRRKNRRFGGSNCEYSLLEYASNAPVQFSYKELKGLTSGFKEKLGSGRFGSVYRGNLANGAAVAVKKLERIEEEEKQFWMEIANICSTHHMNLLRMVGFCCEGQHRFLVYEFMKNGTLDKYLFEAENKALLDWQCRFNIAYGCAKGIAYLHEKCRNCIVHGGIKPENIFLDENHKAKLSDIGLVNLMSPKDQRFKNMLNVRGSKAYVAPELLSNLYSTSKSDVYSFGMVLLELVSGRRSSEISEETNDKELLVWASEEFENGNVIDIVDKRLPANEVNLEQVRRVILTGFQCIQEQPELRPTMGKVMQMLEGIIEPQKPPTLKSMNVGFSSLALETNLETKA